MHIDNKKNAELIRDAVGSDGERIVHRFGKKIGWLKKQYSGEYPNFWTVNKKWLWAFAKERWSKFELFDLDYQFFKRELWAEVNGLTLPPRFADDERLIKIQTLTNELLAI